MIPEISIYKKPVNINRKKVMTVWVVKKQKVIFTGHPVWQIFEDVQKRLKWLILPKIALSWEF